MLIEKNGRTNSKRTRAELEAMIRKELASLRPDERETLEILLTELKDQPDPAAPKLIDVLGVADYERTPVDMRTFIRDPYYLGNTCDTLYPKLEDDLVELFENNYHEAILSGSIGWGKTFFASIGICRVLYELSCLKNPQHTYGIASGSVIAFVVFSVNEMLAVKVAFENVAQKIKASPYFQDKFPFEDTKKELRFPKNVWVAARATSDSSALGLNVIGAIVDETNFMPKTSKERAMNIPDRAESIYANIKRRMKSRFERAGISLPGKLFIVSSKKTTDDFTAKLVRGSKNDPSVFVRDYATWDVKPDSYFTSQKFYVLVGNESTPSRIIPEGENIAAVREQAGEGVQIVDVPEDFRADFERDLEGAIRDIAGMSTVSVNPFINRREKILEAVDKTRTHPYTTMIMDPSKPGVIKWPDLVQTMTERNTWTGNHESVNRPRVNPRAIRHVHIDPSLRGDCTGLCVAHIHSWKDVMRRGEDGNQYVEKAPVYFVDFMLRIVPPLGDEIVLAEVRHLVYEFARHGYPLQTITMDSWQTADSIQTFRQKGYNAEVLSVDVTTDPYDNLKTALYENRVIMYEYPPVLDELKHLERHILSGRKTKVDHPDHGSKDVSDALAGCLFTLSQKTPAPLPIMRGNAAGGGGDMWLPEQQGAYFGGNVNAASNTSVMPFILGNGPRDDDDGGWGPGW